MTKANILCRCGYVNVKYGTLYNQNFFLIKKELSQQVTFALVLFLGQVSFPLGDKQLIG